jgi:hypothetical protein
MNAPATLYVPDLGTIRNTDTIICLIAPGAGVIINSACKTRDEAERFAEDRADNGDAFDGEKVAEVAGYVYIEAHTIGLANRAVELIAHAERDGCVIDDGNVIDFLADHFTRMPLSDLRAVLAIAAASDPIFAARFPNAVKVRS